ncbi:MAG: hypothetical protein ICV78_19370 [Tolypothrix sp. Co-bin9]|nr:hypothetical protein [Tolypothrix sp. Co-bin9]
MIASVWKLGFEFCRASDRVIDIESIAIAALCYKGELPSIIAYNQFLRPDVR